MSLEVDAALGGVWDELGNLIKQSGVEDSSGYRRYLSSRLAAFDFVKVANCLKITIEDAKTLRQRFIKECGEPA